MKRIRLVDMLDSGRDIGTVEVHDSEIPRTVINQRARFILTEQQKYYQFFYTETIALRWRTVLEDDWPHDGLPCLECWGAPMELLGRIPSFLPEE